MMYLCIQKPKYTEMMTALTVRDFRSQMASSFNRVDAGEQVYIRRGNHLYTLVAIEDADLSITAHLAAKIEKARAEYREGSTLKFENAVAAQKWMDEL
ncbi:MAG: hypothetical protein J6T35_00195 [Bacteroidales bacterium]|nr:hypothetical protein [Bacteroidales bacterium]